MERGRGSIPRLPWWAEHLAPRDQLKYKRHRRAPRGGTGGMGPSARPGAGGFYLNQVKIKSYFPACTKHLGTRRTGEQSVKPEWEQWFIKCVAHGQAVAVAPATGTAWAK